MPMTVNERNKRWFPVLIACAILIGASMWASVLLPLDDPASAKRDTATTVTDYPQTLKAWDGKLARFADGGTVPLEVYDVDVATLPADEQQRLADGIPVPDDTTLSALLDNYTS